MKLKKILFISLVCCLCVYATACGSKQQSEKPPAQTETEEIPNTDAEVEFE